MTIRNNTFIINPSAGFGKTGKNLKALLKEISFQDPQAKILLTRHALHAMSLTKMALNDGAHRIIVIGGDGTLNEVINGFFDKDGKPHNEQAEIALVPSGTGSDFARGIYQGQSLKERIEFALNSDAKPTDVGLTYAHDANGVEIKRYFINVSSVGLSGLVAGFMKTVTKKLGPTAAYFIATVQAIRELKATTFIIKNDSHTMTVDNCSLVSFANGQYFGSGMRVAPNAKVDDGLFDVISIKDLSPLFFIVNGYRIYQGTHLTLNNVGFHQLSECTIESTSPQAIYVETDGELFAQLPARYEIKRHAVKMVR